METRTLTQIKIYKLVLNPMRGNTEGSDLVAIAYDKQKLIDWYNEQKAPEGYVNDGPGSFPVHGDTHQWHKTFKKDGPLEWYNPCSNFEEPDHYGHGIQWKWTTEEDISKFMNRYSSRVTLVQ